MAFICTPLAQQRDSRAARAATAEGVWVRFLIEVVFQKRLDPQARLLLSPYLQENIQTLLQRKLLLRTSDGPTPIEVKFEVEPGWMLSNPVLEIRFAQAVPMEEEVRDQLAALLEESLNAAIVEGRILGGQREYLPLRIWVRAHPDQRCWPSPSLL